MGDKCLPFRAIICFLTISMNYHLFIMLALTLRRQQVDIFHFKLNTPVVVHWGVLCMTCFLFSLHDVDLTHLCLSLDLWSSITTYSKIKKRRIFHAIAHAWSFFVHNPFPPTTKNWITSHCKYLVRSIDAERLSAVRIPRKRWGMNDEPDRIIDRHHDSWRLMVRYKSVVFHIDWRSLVSILHIHHIRAP
jgi:hypothetical protein